MPVLTPLSTLTATGTIATLQPLVIDALQGRTDISNDMLARHVAAAMREITESNPFEELRTTGPQFTLTAGLADYPIDLFLNFGDDYTSAEAFAIFVDPPGNQTLSNFKFRTPKAIMPMTAPTTTGTPGWFTRFGGNFRFGPVPDKPYTVYLPYQARITFSDPPVITDPIYITPSWFDIVAYSAAMRICIPKRWTDQRKELHDLLFGDPEYQTSGGKRGRPGLMQARLFQVERDQNFDTRSLGIMQSHYGGR